MTYEEYLEIMKKNNLEIGKDGIIYKVGKGNKNRPICNNLIFQDLVVKKQETNNLSGKEDNLLGSCVMTLVKIVLNNVKFRFQKEELREEVVTEAYCDIFSAINKGNFNPAKGNAYSFFFRIAYTAGIHVLEKWNGIKKLEETFEEMYLMDHCGRKVDTTNSNFV